MSGSTLDRIAVSGRVLNTMRGSAPPHDLLTNDLRIRVLEGEDLTAEEMLFIVNEIRQGRRTAARPTAAPSAGRAKRAPPPTSTLKEDLRAILDQDLG